MQVRFVQKKTKKTFLFLLFLDTKMERMKGVWKNTDSQCNAEMSARNKIAFTFSIQKFRFNVSLRCQSQD
jgi:hypothetical protein